MASEAVNNYITKRYERWLDYSFVSLWACWYFR